MKASPFVIPLCLSVQCLGFLARVGTLGPGVALVGVKLPRGLSVRLERFQVMAIVWERRKMLPAELR
jgi:hypothetical protein